MKQNKETYISNLEISQLLRVHLKKVEISDTHVEGQDNV